MTRTFITLSNYMLARAAEVERRIIPKLLHSKYHQVRLNGLKEKLPPNLSPKLVLECLGYRVGLGSKVLLPG